MKKTGRTPYSFIAKLNSDIAKALQSPEVAARVRAGGYDPVGSSPAEMAAVIKTESGIRARVIKSASIRVD